MTETWPVQRPRTTTGNIELLGGPGNLAGNPEGLAVPLNLKLRRELRSGPLVVEPENPIENPKAGPPARLQGNSEAPEPETSLATGLETTQNHSGGDPGHPRRENLIKPETPQGTPQATEPKTPGVTPVAEPETTGETTATATLSGIRSSDSETPGKTPKAKATAGAQSGRPARDPRKAPGQGRTVRGQARGTVTRPPATRPGNFPAVLKTEQNRTPNAGATM